MNMNHLALFMRIHIPATQHMCLAGADLGLSAGFLPLKPHNFIALFRRNDVWM